MSVLNHFTNPKSEFKNGWRIHFKRPLAARAGVLLLCLAAADSLAQTQTVTSCTEAALRSAMAGGGTVTFACSGTITLGNSITNVRDTRLDASGHQITISGGNVVRVFYVNTNATLTLVNLTIADGLSTNGYGGGIYNEGTFNATNCLFAANTVQSAEGGYMGLPAQDGCGGAVYNSGALNLIDCSFVSNSACGGQGGHYAGGGGGGGGGAVYNSGALDIVDCSFVSNSALGGQGNLQNWEFGMGGGGGRGGGGAICNLGGMVIERSLFASNSTVGGVGGVGHDGGNGDSYDWPVPHGWTRRPRW